MTLTFVEAVKHPLDIFLPPRSRGEWMQTYSGGAFFVNDVRLEEVCIADIAHALSLQCRYTGHCERFYSVAEHSYWVSYLVPPQYALEGLLHDAPEAYLVDIARPVKVGLKDYKALEHRIWLRICAALKIHSTLPDCVHHADNAILFSERDQNMKAPPYRWSIPDPGYRIKLGLWPARKAERMFLKRYRELTNTQTRWERAAAAFLKAFRRE